VIGSYSCKPICTWSVHAVHAVHADTLVTYSGSDAFSTLETFRFTYNVAVTMEQDAVANEQASKIAELQSQIKATCNLLAVLDIVNNLAFAKQLTERIRGWLAELDDLCAPQPQPQEDDAAGRSSTRAKRKREPIIT
jgi:hypothetical protein